MEINTSQVFAAMRRAGMTVEADALERGEAVLGTVCEIAGYGNQSGKATASSDCACKGGADTTAMADGGAGIVPVWNLPGAAPSCYTQCTGVDKCLVPLLREARSRFDDHAWMQLWTKDPTIVHFSKVVSPASAPYVAAFPLVANSKIIVAQEDAQQLPYLPGYFKFTWKFSVTDAKDNVKVRIFTGPRGLTGLTSTTALVQIGNDLTLADFECHDDCYFLPYPDLLGCQSSGIPDTRSIYIELEADGLGGGGNQLDSTNLSMLKRGSKKYKAACGQYNLEMY